MDNNSERDISIYICTFSANVETANVLIKFPCQYFLEWKTVNGKKVVEGKSRPTAKNSLVQFNETLEFSTEMIFDNAAGKFLRKDTLLNLNLISKSRQDQVKLIGRVTIDLADLANRQEYQYSKPYKLSYCSVDAELTFSAVMESKRPTNINPQDLDKSSFNDYFSFYSCASSPRQNRQRRQFANTESQETSIGYSKQTQEHAIDIPLNQQRQTKPFNQTFFMFSSPKLNRTREISRTMKENGNESERVSNIRSEVAVRSPSGSKEINNSRSTQLTNNLATRVKIDEGNRLQEDQRVYEKEKQRFRGEIDGNREKIEELERKIIQLSINLEDSKRHLEFTERQNKQKEEIIKILKQNEFRTDQQTSKKRQQTQLQKSNNLHLKEYIQLQEKIERLAKQRSSDQRQWKSKEDIYKNQILQFQSSTDMLRKQTDEFRKMWQEKKDHYEEKIAAAEQKIKQKDFKISELNTKVQELLKFKYQYQILKELNDEKDQKIKTAERTLNALKYEIDQINKNNYAEEIYKLKLQIAQTTKNHEELSVRHAKCDEEINKYRESYIKIETAYEIQGKNYDSCKQKSNQYEVNIFNLQKQSIELKNNLSNSIKGIQQLNNKLLNAQANQAVQQKLYQQLQLEQKKSLNQFENIMRQRQEQNILINRLRLQQQAKNKEVEQTIKKIESTIISAQERKEKQMMEEQGRLLSSITQLQSNNHHLQQTITNLESNLSELKHTSEITIQNKQTVITNLQSVLADKQQIIKMCNNQLQTLRESNAQLTDTLREMNIKEKQLEENIMILEEESHKILYILEQKEQLDKELQELQQKYRQAIEKNQTIAALVQQQRIKIQQNLRIIEEKDLAIRENQSIIQELHQKMSRISDEALSIQHQLSQKDIRLQSKTQQAYQLQNELQQIKTSTSCLRQELYEFKSQVFKLKQIIKQINQRYEQHLKLEQKYHLQISSVRQEKEELQLFISKNNNQFANYNQQLESRATAFQKDIDRLEHELAFGEEERKHFQQKCNSLQNQKRTLQAKIEDVKTENMRIEREKYETVAKLETKMKEYKQLELRVEQSNRRMVELQQVLSNLNLQHHNLKNINEDLAKQVLQHQSSLHLIEAQRNNLNDHIDHLQQQIQLRVEDNNQQGYNQLIQMNEEIEMQAAQSILEERKIVDQEKYEQISHQLSESEQRVKSLEEKIEQLNLQIRNLVYEIQKNNNNNNKALYEDFPQFHREEMTKIIEEQRKEIDRLQAQNKLKLSKNSSVLQDRIRQLESNIVQLQSSFRMEIDRILSGHTTNKQQGLSVINEEVMDDETLKSQKSLATPNRVKQSIDSAEAFEFKEKWLIIQEEKQHLEELLDASQEEKFNLMSTINEKDIVFEEALRIKMMLQMEVEDLRKINQHAHSQLHSLSAQIQSLRNQVNFGTSILNDQQSVTRSEPIIVSEQVNQVQNKDIQIQHLRAEVEKCKLKEEQLCWNIKDLQMQLETVTESLNLLNGSAMNSFLKSSEKLSSEEEQPVANNQEYECGYSKERLLQSLRRNQQLKQIAHNIIRALKQRQKQAEEQQRLLKDLSSNRAIINSALSNRNTLKLEVMCKKIPPLCKEFQTLKMQVAKAQSGKDTKDEGTFKSLLIFEQKLKELKLLTQRQELSASDY